jgi:hypothetical protein
MGVMAGAREGGGDDAFRDALVADVGDVIDPEAATALGDVHVFPAQLQAADVAAGPLADVGELLERAVLRLAGPVGEQAAAAQVGGVEVGIGVLLQVGAEHGLRLVPFGHPDGLEAALRPHPGMHADEVDRAGAQRQQLGHDGVVVLGRRDVTVGAGLGLGGPHRVREVGREGLAGEAGGGDRRLLHIDALAVDVGRRQHQGRG